MVGILTVTAACAMNSPKEQAERERKAASVQVFKLHMTKDLWTRINVGNNNSTKIVGKPKSLTDDPNGMVTIELTGPQLVDYLQSLDYNAHGGLEAKDPSLAAAVYDTFGAGAGQDPDHSGAWCSRTRGHRRRERRARRI
jgi:hypothetical protein